MSGRTVMLAAFAIAAATGLCRPDLAAGAAESLSVQEALAKAPSHPRLFWPEGGEDAVREKMARDERFRQVWEAVRVTADCMLAEPPVRYRKEGRRLLGRSREALGRLMHLSFAARMTGDSRYVERAVAEMKAAAAMPDWNPSHFLDTAEMTMAMAVGYDWLYAKLSDEDKAVFRAAIESKGLQPYLGRKNRHGWERGNNNWNQVCHGGMVAGALALLEDDRQRAVQVVERAIAGLPYAMKVYEPDGTYPEGPGYWNYGTTFNVAVISMLESAAGTDFGLSERPGFLKTGDFPLHMTGSTGRYFNFSDCGRGTSFSPAMIWFATRTHHAGLLWFEQGLLQRELRDILGSKGKNKADRCFPLVLIWGEPGVQRAEPTTRNWLGRGPNPLAVFRSSWTDPNALYLAIKAGSPGANHGHMDVGSFVLDADGVRWSLDLGAQGYHEMESRGLDIWNKRPGSDRWKIFRYHNRAHSTLMVDDQEQVVESHAPISEFSAESDRRCAVVDLSETYRGQLRGAVRRFTLESDDAVSIADQIEGGEKACSVRWAMVTPATVKPEGPGKAILQKDGKHLRLEVLSPPEVSIRTWPAERPPAEFDEPNPGVVIVGFTVPVESGGKAKLSVRLTRGG